MTLLADGERKYLNQAEMRAFLKAAQAAPRDVRTFCSVLLFTGCRPVEALELTGRRVDFSGQGLIFKTLKKRGDMKGKDFRLVPVPARLLEEIDLVHGVKDGQTGPDDRLWSWSYPTAWRRVKEVMAKAGIEGVKASPKGLRHSFGVHVVMSQMPLNKAQQWLGHSALSTTAIYANAQGEEEIKLINRLWESL